MIFLAVSRYDSLLGCHITMLCIMFGQIVLTTHMHRIMELRKACSAYVGSERYIQPPDTVSGKDFGFHLLRSFVHVWNAAIVCAVYGKQKKRILTLL